MKVRCPFCATRKPADMTCPNPACPTHRGRESEEPKRTEQPRRPRAKG